MRSLEILCSLANYVANILSESAGVVRGERVGKREKAKENTDREEEKRQERGNVTIERKIVSKQRGC